MTWEMIGRAAVYFAALGVYGALGLRVLVARADRSVASDSTLPRALATLTVAFAACLLIATLLRLVCQSMMTWGAADGLSWHNLQVVGLESRWGGRWQWQPIAALVTLVGALVSRWLPRLGTAVVALSAIALAVALPMTGHAYGDAKSWVAQSVHVLAAGLWMGTLMMALVVPLREVAGPTEVRRRWLEAFSPLAGGAALAVVVSGVVVALDAFPSWRSLLDGGYARSFVIKLGLVACVAALGARNFLSLRRGSARGLWAAARAEAGLGLAVLMVTAVLTSLSPPDMAH